MSFQSLAWDLRFCCSKKHSPRSKTKVSIKQWWKTYLVFISGKKKTTKHKDNARFYGQRLNPYCGMLLFGNSIIPILFLTEVARKVMTRWWNITEVCMEFVSIQKIQFLFGSKRLLASKLFIVPLIWTSIWLIKHCQALGEVFCYKSGLPCIIKWYSWRPMAVFTKIKTFEFASW